jgi:hypothetical protein
MGFLFINIDVSELQDLLELESLSKDAMQSAARDLTAATRAKIVEIADQKLHTRRGKFIEALTHFQLDDNTFVVNLDASARWIDEGMTEHNMLDDLLASKKAKTSKDGKSKYIVVPFQHNQAKQNLTPGQQKLLATIKKELAKVGATPNKLEVDAAGKPKLGLVRSLDITKGPPSTPSNPIGRGIGGTAVGPTGTPLLKGVQVYQKEIKDKNGESRVGRFVMTFRVASSKQKGQVGEESTGAWKKKFGEKKSQARWDHPGIEATNLMQEGLDWALAQWEQKIAPGIIAKLVGQLT